MILEVFIEFFGVKIVIGLLKNHYDLILIVGFDLSQNSRYIYDISDILHIHLRYFTDISPIFIDIFSKISTDARVRYTISLVNQLFVGKIISVPTDIRYFDDISTDISNLFSLKLP